MIRLDGKGQMRGLPRPPASEEHNSALVELADSMVWLVLAIIITTSVMLLLAYHVVPLLPQAVR